LALFNKKLKNNQKKTSIFLKNPLELAFKIAFLEALKNFL